jgi:hypothetical protein
MFINTAMEPAHVPTNRSMDKENAVYIYHGVPFSHKDEITSFSGN